MSISQKNGLTPDQVERFITDGFVKIEHAFDSNLAKACRNELWSDIGLSPDRPETWTTAVIWVHWKSSPPFRAAANSEKLHAAYDDLVGAGRWRRPEGLGSFPIRFPSSQATGDDGWHVDMSLGTDNPDFMEWRANIKSSGRALLMLFLLSDIGPNDAPTRIRKGSHAEIARTLLPQGDAGLTLRQLSADGFASTDGCEIALATGSAGTVYLCHPFLVHAAQPHRGSTPRFIAQPPLFPSMEFDPTRPPSPVQIAIRRACGLTI